MKSLRFFFVAYGGAHIQMLLPVIRRLQALGHETIILALTTAQGVLKQQGIPYIGFADLLEKEDEAALEKGKQLAADLPTPPLDIHETAAYLGLSYHDLEVRHGIELAAQIYAEKNRQGFEPITILKRALIKYKPDMVVVTSSPRAEKAAAHAARECGIPSVCMVDLFGRFTTWASDNNYTDKLLVFSAVTRDFFIENGRAEKDIVITGNPSMDRLADPQWQIKADEWRAARGWNNKKIIFWASHAEPPPYEALPRDIDLAVWNAVEPNEDWALLVRFHPSEAQRPFPESDRIYISPKEEEVTPLIYACDACVIINSTVGLEAAILTKPLISVDLSVFTPVTPFDDMGISRGAKSLAEIKPLIEEAIERGNYQRDNLNIVGNATEAVVRELIAML